MSQRHPRVLRAGSLGMILTAVVLLASPFAACSSEQDEFCDQLRDIYDFSDLRQAIDRDDRAAIEAALADAQELVDRAPSDIETDIKAVVDAVVDSVRAVIDVKGPDGQNMPVDLARLNDALAKVGANAQRVVTYADEKCGITTTTTH